ncbi:MAG TPA: Fis family transcriptional regulator [Sulfurovum sp.]|nr:Fis family transcriptional regulator [Sulfurovum sp.]
METFFTTSDKIQHIIKSFNLIKTLFVSSIIIGDAHIGKKSLARYLFPDAPLVSGKSQEEVQAALENYDEVIISDFEKLSNPSDLDFTNKRIIATANYLGNPKLIDELFAFIYTMPALQERPDDVKYLHHKFITEAIHTMMIDKADIDVDNIPRDLSFNSRSLKQSTYSHIIKQTIGIHDITKLLHDYFYTHFEGNDNYRKHLGLYEKPLIEAGLKKFGSQLQLAQILGINRNTLRKKIYEHKID